MPLKEQGTLLIEGRELVEDTFIPFGKSFLKGLARLWRKQVVEPFSAARYFGDPFKVPASDHLTIAKPENRDAIQHRLLCEFIKEFRLGVGRRRQLRRVVLRVGLSSETPETIGRMLNVCQSIVNVVLQEGEKSLLIDSHLFQEYDAAFHNFDHHLDDYDIVMLDCVWLPHFSSRLANLSELESFEDFFKEKMIRVTYMRSRFLGMCNYSYTEKTWLRRSTKTNLIYSRCVTRMSFWIFFSVARKRPQRSRSWSDTLQTAIL